MLGTGLRMCPSCARACSQLLQEPGIKISRLWEALQKATGSAFPPGARALLSECLLQYNRLGMRLADLQRRGNCDHDSFRLPWCPVCSFR